MNKASEMFKIPSIEQNMHNGGPKKSGENESRRGGRKPESEQMQKITNPDI